MWYSRIVASLDALPDFISHYERELEDAKKDCKIYGIVEKNITALPGVKLLSLGVGASGCDCSLISSDSCSSAGLRRRRCSTLDRSLCELLCQHSLLLLCLLSL